MSYESRVHVLRNEDGDLLCDRVGLPRSFPSEDAAEDYAAHLVKGEWTAEAAEADRNEVIDYLREAWGDWQADLAEAEWELGYALLDELKHIPTDPPSPSGD